VEDRRVKLVLSLSLALGVASVVAGSLAVSFGVDNSIRDYVVVASGWGPLDKVWTPLEYCIIGTILTAGGTGVGMYGLVWLMLLFRQGPAILPRRRWLVWSPALLAGALGVGIGGMVLLTQRAPKLSGELARRQITLFLVLTGESRDSWYDRHRRMTTPEYRQREESLKESVKYMVATCHITSTAFDISGQVTVRGSITALTKTTVFQAEKGILHASGVMTALLDPPKEVEFIARLIEDENYGWLIDELAFEER
jgi:hypothetical protein